MISKSNYIKLNILLFVVLSLTYVESVQAADYYSAVAPKFTKVVNLTSGPITNSEPINIFWEDSTASEISSLYTDNGWKLATSSLFNFDNYKIWLDFDPFPFPCLHLAFDQSSSVSASPNGNGLVNNYLGKTLVANSEYTTIATIGLVKFDLPMKRDHFRIWDLGSNVVMGSATYDNGLLGELTSDLLTILNNPLIEAIINTISIVALLTLNPVVIAASIIAQIGIVAAAAGLDLLFDQFNAGHLIDQNNPWKTVYTARNTWDYYDELNTYTGFFRLSNPETWTLTGRTQTWDGLAYKLYATEDTGGGGGCVAKGTRILLADGVKEKPVQSLKIGQMVLGYNISSQTDVPVQVTNIIEEIVPSLLVINDGALKLTPTNQPIYARNSTYTGWIRDPKDLKVGDEIFCVKTHSWTKILKIDTILGKFKVFDIETAPLNVFVGNGFLLDIKPPIVF